MGTKVYDNYEDLITFNRNSKGTALRPIGYGDELVTNGTFDTDASGWTATTGFVISEVSQEANVSYTTGSGLFYVGPFQTITTEVGKVYAVSFDVTALNGNLGRVRIESSLGGGQYINTGSLNVGSYEYRFVATGTTTYVNLCVQSDVTSDVTYDNISVKEVLFDREGDPLTLYLHPEGVPRIEYDADRNLKGLLIEPDGQNKCLQSENLIFSWTPSNATITTNATTAPDGTATADKLNDDSGGGTSDVAVRQTINASAGTKYTASVFLKADQLSFARLEAFGIDTGVDGAQFFGLSGAGTKGTASAAIEDSKIEAYPNGWYRCSITWTQGDTQFFFFIQVANSISNFQVPLDGTSSIFAWGAQVEEGPIATSYMPTTGSPFTRGKDEASMTNVSGLIGQKEGTLYLEVDARNVSGVSQDILYISNNNFTNRIYITLGTGGELRAEGNGILISGGGSSGIIKIALGYADNNSNLFANGSQAGTTDTTCTISSGKTDIDIGQSYAASNQANMWIRAVQIIPRRLSNEQLIELTS